MNNANNTLPALMKAVSNKDAGNMKARIKKAFHKREAFELKKEPNGTHIELRRAERFLLDNDNLARMLVVLNADPDLMLNRERKEGYRSNLKGFQKIKSLLQYIVGESLSFERVSLALFASTIIAAKSGIERISNVEQELVLSNVPVSSFPKELQSAIEDYKHKFMRLRGDSRNQSCQFRTTFDNLGAYTFDSADSSDKNGKGIIVNMESPLIQYLAARWKLEGTKLPVS